MQAIQTWKENIQSRDFLSQVMLHILYWPPKHSTDEDKLVERKSTKNKKNKNKTRTNKADTPTSAQVACHRAHKMELKSGMELNHNDLWESFII